MELWLEIGGVQLEDLVPVAVACDRAGVAGVSVSDHLVLPATINSSYPYSRDGSFEWAAQLPWPDAWVSIGAMAVATRRLRFTTAVYVAPLRQPLALAKAVSTASELSGGRLVCGLGAGWMEEEFVAAGEDFASRGQRFDEILQIMPLLWSGEMVSYHGTHYSFEPVRMLPGASNPIPIWVGGNTSAGKRRAAASDGWICAYKNLEQAALDLADLRQKRRSAGQADRTFTSAVVGPLRKPADLRRLGEEGFDVAIVPITMLTRERDMTGWHEAIEAAIELAGAVGS